MVFNLDSLGVWSFKEKASHSRQSSIARFVRKSGRREAKMRE